MLCLTPEVLTGGDRHDGLFPVGQGAAQGGAAAARCRRGLRRGAPEPPRVHPAGDHPRPVDGAIGMVIAACSGTAASPAASGGAASAGGERRRQRGSPPAGASTGGKQGGSIRVAAQRPSGPLDPVGMQDLGSYGVTAASFEFLCTADPSGSLVNIVPGLATKWTPDATASVWTFDLRQGVKWQDGADVHRPPTSSRRWSGSSKAGNSGLKGVLPAGGAVATDPNTVTFNLTNANGNFPYLVSVFNAQTLITPTDYAAGTTLDKQPERNGRLEARQLQRGDRRVLRPQRRLVGRQDAARHGRVDFFDATGPMVTAYQGGQVDAIIQFDVLSGKALFDDPNFTSLATPGRRSIARSGCERTRASSPTSAFARRSPCRSTDPSLIQQLFQGKADLGNDHPIAPVYPYFDPSVPQRAQDIAKAKQLLSDAGVSEPDGHAPLRPAPRDPRPRHAAQEPGRPGRDHARTWPSRASTRSTAPVVPGKAGRPSVLRSRRARDRGLRPPRDPRRVPQLGAQDQGRLELVAVLLAGVRRGVHRRSRAPSASMPRRRPPPRSRRSSSKTRRSACRTSTTTSPAIRRSSPDVYSSGLGQMFFSTASKV